MLKTAKELAFSRDYRANEERICCIITDKRGLILSIGENSYRDSCKLQRFYARVVGLPEKVFNHAEIAALKKLQKGDKPYAAYIARVNKKGEGLLAKPCPICSKALQNFGVTVVHYTGISEKLSTKSYPQEKAVEKPVDKSL